VGGARDEADFRSFVLTHRGGLVSLARHLYRLQPADAEDLVQTALARTAARWSGLRDPLAYARRSVVTAGIDRHRWWQRRVQEQSVDTLTLAGLPGTQDASPISDRMDVALASLPNLTRQVLLLRYYVGLSEVEVAELLGRPLGSVKSAAHRGISQLRLVLDPMAAPPERGGTHAAR
jgi:RNA polymerase sigma factor (sigma-70 family)